MHRRIRQLLTGVAAAALAMGGVAMAAPAANASASSCTYVSSSYRPTLSYGSTGAAVKQVQCLINHNSGYPTWLTEDGIFGSNTLSGVKWVQSCNNITVDGIVGSNTWNKLYNPNSGCGI